MSKAFINGAVLRWARERADMPPEQLAKKIGQKADRLARWEAGEDQPTFKQAVRLASVTHVPFGYFFLPQPPVEDLPLPDLRTVGGEPARAFDSNTTDLIRDVLFKHAWFVEHLKQQGHEPLSFVARYRLTDSPVDIAANIRSTLNLTDATARSANWEEFIRLLIDSAEAAGVWIMRTGIVGSDTHRSLSVRQFRGFAISDPVAPLVFINGKDALAAQIFTFAHELAHIWLGSSGVSNVQIGRRDYGTSRRTEIVCNAVAAELLVPRDDFEKSWSNTKSQNANYDDLARRFKVSRIVIARRALDLGKIPEGAYSAFYKEEEDRWEEERREQADKASGGNFYSTLPLRNGSRFTNAVVSSAMSGDTLLRDAASLLNIQPATVVKFYKKATAPK
ncbi:XRE family transcriptional regulator [Bradyrhizobium glycinis]|uniref:XRE family transcriptional regulator n=1 Tax=Bradyrhizobium glycinis TaxID=2751812 RepID=UPI0018D7D4C2|nr:XRE family transcriptional regulator [Bradyrhizobium glycinis]MBH5371223.1 ImmA/IrrE family metallo-endopeptidase [Bradyrhizobium glycinis]